MGQLKWAGCYGSLLTIHIDTIDILTGVRGSWPGK